MAEILGPDCEAARQEEEAAGTGQSTPLPAITGPDLLKAWEQDQKSTQVNKPSKGSHYRVLGKAYVTARP